MPVQVRQATTNQDLDAIFKLRHQFFNPTSQGRLFDAFDSYPNNTNFLILWDKQPKGCVRLTTTVQDGQNINEVFKGENPQTSEAYLTHLCIDPQIQHKHLLARALLKAVARHVKIQNIQNLVGYIHPSMKNIFNGMEIETFDQTVTCAPNQEKLIQIGIQTPNLIDQSWDEPDIPLSSSRAYFQDQDILFKSGDKARALYAVIQGKVDLIINRPNDKPILAATVGAGELLGEAINEDGTHFYTAMARDFCEVGTVSEIDLVEHLKDSPDKLRETMSHLSLRVRNLSQVVLDGGRSKLSGLRLFNDYLVARVVYALSQLGFFEWLKDKESFSVKEASQGLNAPQENLAMILGYLVEMNILLKKEDQYFFENHLRQVLHKEMGFLEWLIGGYDPVLNATEDLIKGKKTYGKDVTRDDRHMAAGSALISKWFTDSHMIKLLEMDDVNTIADIGCGSALRIIDLCKRMPKLKAVGIDVSEHCCRLANENVAQHNMKDRISIVTGKAEGWLKREGQRLREMGGDQKRPVDLVLCFAMFHDLLNHEGMAESFLRDIKEGLGPNAYLLIQDQMRLPEEEWGRAPSWCHGFELIHHFMGQSLFLKEEYEELFAKVGLTIVQRAPTDIPENWIYLLKT